VVQRYPVWHRRAGRCAGEVVLILFNLATVIRFFRANETLFDGVSDNKGRLTACSRLYQI
jgi:hypothetical protein